MRLSPAFAPALLAALAGAGLAGTAIAGTPVPREVRLSDEVLSISLSDGSLCRLRNWQARPEGRFEGCGGLGYSVTLERHSNPLRRLAEGIEKAVDGHFLQPMASITITDAAGQTHRFASPAPLAQSLR